MEERSEKENRTYGQIHAVNVHRMGVRRWRLFPRSDARMGNSSGRDCRRRLAVPALAYLAGGQ